MLCRFLTRAGFNVAPFGERKKIKTNGNFAKRERNKCQQKIQSPNGDVCVLFYQLVFVISRNFLPIRQFCLSIFTFRNLKLHQIDQLMGYSVFATSDCIGRVLTYNRYMHL